MQKVPQSHSKIFKSITLAGTTYKLPNVKGKSIRVEKGRAIIEGEDGEVVVDIISGQVEKSVDNPKNWYENWSIEWGQNPQGNKTIKVYLPKALGVFGNKITFDKVTDARVFHLVDIIDSALSELSRRDKEKENG